MKEGNEMTEAELLEATGVRQTFIAEKLGVTRQHVYAVVKGQRRTPKIVGFIRDYCVPAVERLKELDRL